MITSQLGKITKDSLVIEIPFNVLKRAFEMSEVNNPYCDDEESSYFCDYVRQFKVTNVEQFAKDVLTEIFREEEDGTTPLAKMIDEACQCAVESGSWGVEEDGKPVGV